MPRTGIRRLPSDPAQSGFLRGCAGCGHRQGSQPEMAVGAHRGHRGGGYRPFPRASRAAAFWLAGIEIFGVKPLIRPLAISLRVMALVHLLPAGGAKGFIPAPLSN